MNIRQLIKEGECETVDFKQTITSVQKIAKTLVAFANTKGGKLLVGVKDNGNIVGVRPAEERHMLEGANHFCKPPVEIKFSKESIEGKIVLIAEIPESENKPHYAKGEDQKWWAYIRVKDKCLLASKVMLDVMKSESRGEESKITFGNAEKRLLEYLDKNEKVTMKEFCKMANISRWRANRILVNMVRMKVIKVLSHEKTDYYSI
ncbi:MAG: ATP-binding protein [Cytophagaceae bacterium]|nr:ATP-binding protein [Cytophagaceae bacterium]